MNKKSFFRERSVAEIGRLAKVRPVYKARGLVELIDNLNLGSEALELRMQVMPGRFYANTKTGSEAARKCYKHGDLISLSQPETQADAHASREIPLAGRARDFAKLAEMREEEINFVGYSWYPVQGRDRRKRIVPFVGLSEAARLYAYAENVSNGIEVRPYADCRRVATEGATVVCSVPSRTKKKPRHEIKLMHVPVIDTSEKRAVIWSLKPEYAPGQAPEHDFWNIRYTREHEPESSDVIRFGPHAIAAYFATVGHMLRTDRHHSMTPMDMNPFALPSKHQADFYNKLCNNVVIYDPSLRGKNKLRKLHLAEKSILLARAIGKFGNEDFAYWDSERDGRIKDYRWGI